jgi:hypothetical protein
MTRTNKRRHLPPSEPLKYAIAAQRGLMAAESERDRAFLSAASAGWSVREIAEAIEGLSASTVWRCIVRAEGAE